MLAEYQLDTEKFSDIMDEAKNMVVSMYPDWTDFNYHDPGITMLELFSWIKEGQQYFMDQIGPEHRVRYLKLLGMRRRHRIAARTEVNIRTQVDFTVLKGAKLSAGQVQFETDARQRLVDNQIIQCFHGKSGLENACIGGEIEKNDNLRLPVFGNDPKPMDSWYIGFEKPLPMQETIGIQISLAAPESDRQRVPLHAPLPVPMLRLSYEYCTADGWDAIERYTDDTYGMLQDGILYLAVSKPMALVDVFGEPAYYIRIRVEESDMDLPPILERIRINVLPVRQKDTWAELELAQADLQGGQYTAFVRTYLAMVGLNDLYLKDHGVYYPVAATEKYVNSDSGETKFVFSAPASVEQKSTMELVIVSYMDRPEMKKCLGIGNGLPYQAYELPSPDALYESIEIFVHEIGSHGGFSWWERVEDFGASTPGDRHFMVDNEEGRIYFGDCERGMAPEGEIFLVSFATTQGENGNAKQGTIRQLSQFEAPFSDAVTICNESDAVGGMDEESFEECFFRARKLLKSADTAVTYADYERLVKETPGLMIASCKAISLQEMRMIQEHPQENSLTLVVKAEGRQDLTDSYRRNILLHLEPYRLLGMQINIIPPCYVLLEVFLDFAARPHFPKVKEQVSQALDQYFSGLSKEFGATIIYSELYGMVDMLECVAMVNDITLDIRDGKVTRMQDGNIILPPNGVLVLKQVHYSMSLSD